SYCSEGHSAVLLTRSFDRGGSFQTPVIVDRNNADDKPTMRLRSVPGRPAHVFVAWTRWYSHGSAIWFARSTNGGASFSTARLLFTTQANAFGAVPVVLPNRRIVVLWASSTNVSTSSEPRTRIMDAVSTDEGAHFDPARAATSWFSALPQLTQPGSLRVILSPAATADERGNLYLAWSVAHPESANGSARADILVERSTDGGRHWGRPVRVNDVRSGDRFMPALTVLSDGSLGVAFYDRRDGWNQLGVYAADVTFSPRARVGPNVRINAASTPIGLMLYIRPGSTCFAPGRFFGDYIGAAPGPGRSIDVTWADTALHGVRRTDVWYANQPLPDPAGSRTVLRVGSSARIVRVAAGTASKRR
ncbi:MAG TPA: sialidase family protein, partial [Chloroflexota bacterium]|nr:sialidase family protein [Chloroflexota bacterium]